MPTATSPRRPALLRRTLGAWSTACLLLCAGSTLAVGGCQQRRDPTPTLTQDQWRRVQENLLETAPSPQFPVDAVFGEQVRLIGWDMEEGSVAAGERFAMTFYWEVLQANPNERWQIFVHLDGSGRQNLDHDAIGGIYPSVYWQTGQIIQDRVEGELSNALGDGTIEVFVGLFRENDRLEVSRAGLGTVADDGRLGVGSFSATWNPPDYSIRRATGAITIDGALDEPAWRRAPQTSRWVNPNDGAATPLESWAKLLWDDEYLYVGMYAEDPDIAAAMTDRDQNLWEEEEVLEIYIDTGGDGRNYLEFQINPQNAVFDARFPRPTNRDLEPARAWNLEALETAVAIDGVLNDASEPDRSWTAEVRIPWTSLPDADQVLPLENGREFRLNFYRYDRSTGRPTTYYAWSPIGGGSFHKPERFGVARLQGNPRRRAIEPAPDGATGIVVQPPAATEGSGTATP